MRAAAFIALGAAVLGALNFLVWRKEQTLRSGRTVFLRLAPMDPRSLMQGDYMALNYDVSDRARTAAPASLPRDGFVVVRVDERNVGEFARFHGGEPLAADECLLRYRVRDWRGPQVGPRSFFFQEGHAKFYEAARYGEVRVDPSGGCVLVGLRGENLEPLGPGK